VKKARGLSNERSMRKDCAENRWGQRASLSPICRVCGLESYSTYLDVKTGRQVWAHKKLVEGKFKADERKARYAVGHPWRMTRKVMETTYHEEDSKLARARSERPSALK
jgi:hypothetical protein